MPRPPRVTCSRYKLAAATTRHSATQTEPHPQDDQGDNQSNGQELSDQSEQAGGVGQSNGLEPLEPEGLPHDVIMDALASAKQDILRLQEEKQV